MQGSTEKGVEGGAGCTLYAGKGRKCVLSRFDLSSAADAKKTAAKKNTVHAACPIQLELFPLSQYTSVPCIIISLYICLPTLYKAQRKSNVKQWGSRQDEMCQNL